MQVSATSNQIHETQNINSPVQSALPSEKAKIRFLVTKSLVAKTLGGGVSVESTFASYADANQFYQTGISTASWFHLQVFQNEKLYLYEIEKKGTELSSEEARAVKAFSIITDRATTSQTIQSLATKYPNLNALSLQKPTENALVQLSRLTELTSLDIDNSHAEDVNALQKEFDPTCNYTFISDTALAALLDCPKLCSLKLLNVRKIALHTLEILQQKIPLVSWTLTPTVPLPKVLCYSNCVTHLTAAKYNFHDGHYSMQSRRFPSCGEAEAFLKGDAHLVETSIAVRLETEAGSQKIDLKPTVAQKIKPAEIQTVSLDSEMGITVDFEVVMKLASSVHNLILFNASKQMLQAFPKSLQIKTVCVENHRFQQVQELHAQANLQKPSAYDPIDDKAVIVLKSMMPNLIKLTLKGTHNIPQPYIDFLNKTKPGFLAIEKGESTAAVKEEKEKNGKDEK